MRIETGMAQCRDCGRIFQYPRLPGEYSYGEFILEGRSGGIHAYLFLLDGDGDTVIRCVESSLPEEFSDFVEVVARLADAIDGQRLTTRHSCPNCGSADWKRPPEKFREIIGSEEIPDVTFNEFLTLSDEARQKKVTDIALELEHAGLAGVIEVKPFPLLARMVEQWRRIERAGLKPLVPRFLGFFRQLMSFLRM
jgi:hypothetical protein